MSVVISTSADLHHRLCRHLLRSRVEQVAFLLADATLNDPTELHLIELREIRPEEFEVQGGFHVALKDDVRARIIKWAWDRGSCLIEVHSHRTTSAKFSPTDLDGLGEFVPHVWWRLGGRPYCALVFAADGSFDALAWISSPEQPERVDALIIDGRSEIPTGLTHDMMTRPGTHHG